MLGTTIDLIAERPDGSLVLYLIEQGPWRSDALTHLQAIQERVYACFDLVVGGQLPAGYLDSSGRPVVIRVYAYDTPPGKVAGFVQFLADVVASSPKHQDALRHSPNVTSIDFECVEKSLGSGRGPAS